MVRPFRSTTRASPGGVTFAPTASMIPSRMTIVPFSIVPLVIVSIRALVSAQVPACAGAGGWAARGTASATPRRKPLASGGARRMQALLGCGNTDRRPYGCTGITPILPLPLYPGKTGDDGRRRAADDGRRVKK